MVVHLAMSFRISKLGAELIRLGQERGLEAVPGILDLRAAARQQAGEEARGDDSVPPCREPAEWLHARRGRAAAGPAILPTHHSRVSTLMSV